MLCTKAVKFFFLRFVLFFLVQCLFSGLSRFLSWCISELCNRTMENRFLTDEEMDLVQKKTVNIVCKSASGSSCGVVEVEAQGLLHIPFFLHLIQFDIGVCPGGDTLLTEINVHDVLADYIELLNPKQFCTVVTTFCEILATPFVLPFYDLVKVASNAKQCLSLIHI